MIVSMFLTREAFAAKRRKDQDSAVEELRDPIFEAVNKDDPSSLLTAIRNLFAAAYEAESGDPFTGEVPASLTKAVAKIMDKTDEDSDLSATALAIASLILNEATIKAAIDDEDDVFLEWVTMHDTDVRQAHKDTDGQIRPIGEKFDVDGVEMSMPGDVTAPIELWINCRCTLRPTLDMFAQSTEAFRDVSKDERDKRSKDGTALPDGSFPIANCQDLRNAIQAIGRAKDPAKAKAHIRKRKSALGCPDVEIPDSWRLTVTAFGGGGGANLGTSITPYQTVGITPYITTTTGVITMTTATDEKVDDLSGFEGMDDEQIAALEMLVPWHGVLAPEGVASGDGRTFAPDSLTFRDLPLPLTYQKTSDDGHKGSVTVGSIETIERKDGLMLASGWMLSTPEADEVIGLMAHFGKYGVSVDADDAEFDYDEESNAVTFSKARICSASIVSIPAFAEAYVALGPWEEDEALVASGTVFKDLAPGLTEDGPGWLTHPVDTDRLRDYWVRGPGAAKIGWGTPGDFNRCRLNLAKYVKPQYLAGYCANRHYDALGFWPGRPVAGDTETFSPAEGEAPAPALSLVASAMEQIKAPAAWFRNPEFTRPTHVTVTEDGHFSGHIAQWGVCHIGIAGVCTEPPKSVTNYAYFANKRVALDDGTYARTGVITLGGKHAPGGLRAAAATRHYDDTTKAVADVAIGEDEHGIWVNGWVRPGIEAGDVYTLSASDVSGDWRNVDAANGTGDLVAVLAVNTGGFSVRAHVEDGEMISLVAAGMVQEPQSTEPESLTADKLAQAIATAMETVEKNKKQRAATMAALRSKITKEG